MTLLLTFVLGLFFLAGIYIIKLAKNRELLGQLSIAVAFGAMSVLAAFDLLPELMEFCSGEEFYIPLIFVIGGIALLKILDVFIPDHGSPGDSAREMIHIGLISAFAIILHNIIEGMAVYGIALQSFRQGVTLAFGVGLHNIPMGMLIYSTLRNEDRLKRHLVLAMSIGSTFAGGVIMALLEEYMNTFVVGVLISITLGMIIYILVFELLSHMIRSGNRRICISGVLAGMAVVFVSMFFE